ncbi:hypothetical protein D1871_11270 [Nakamurella silvestris]|nr:hypothetical protein D1871_11270 [Nakamurella silvestris]
MRALKLAAAAAVLATTAVTLTACDFDTTACPAGQTAVDRGFFQTMAVGNSVQMFWMPIIECEVSP